MHDKLKEFLIDNERIKAKNKKDNLIKLGLYERVYMPDNVDNTIEYDQYDNERNAFYKKEAIEVSDEVYAKLIKTTKAQEMLGNDGFESTITAKICYAIAIIIFTVGCIWGMISIEDAPLTGIGIIVGTVASGILYIAVGKIVNYLHNIHNAS